MVPLKPCDESVRDPSFVRMTTWRRLAPSTNHKTGGLATLPFSRPRLASAVTSSGSVHGTADFDQRLDRFDRHVLRRYPPVDLCRRDADVAEHVLDVAQPDPVLECMRRERMPQRVRRDIPDPRALRVRLQDQPESLAGEAVAAVVEEKRRLVRHRDRRARLVEIALQRYDCRGTQRHVPLPARLTAAADRRLLQVDVVEIERDEL